MILYYDYFLVCGAIEYRESVVVNLLILKEEYVMEMKKKGIGLKYLLS